MPATSNPWAASFAAELALMMPLWRQAQARFGRTTVGLSFQPPEEWPAFASRFLAGELPAVVGHDTPVLALRFLCDDVKALYGEAAQAEGAAPSGLQVDTWFWQQTTAGQLLIALRDVALSSENNALRTVGVIPAKPRAAAGIRLAARGIGRVPPVAEQQCALGP
jgi:hypothetical protein